MFLSINTNYVFQQVVTAVIQTMELSALRKWICWAWVINYWSIYKISLWRKLRMF